MLFFSSLFFLILVNFSNRYGFNLTIEMLFFSSHLWYIQIESLVSVVSISQLRCFSFQGGGLGGSIRVDVVSISQLRCFSFQVLPGLLLPGLLLQGFNLTIEMLFFSRGRLANCWVNAYLSFNLTIEMLFFSSY